MHRLRVVNRRGDALRLHAALDFIALLDQHGVLRPGAAAIRSLRQRPRTRAAGADALRISAGQDLATIELPRKAAKLRQQDRTLKRIHAATDPDTAVLIPTALTMHADLARGLGDPVVLGEHGAPVTVAAERLARKEAR